MPSVCVIIQTLEDVFLELCENDQGGPTENHEDMEPFANPLLRGAKVSNNITGLLSTNVFTCQSVYNMHNFSQ